MSNLVTDKPTLNDYWEALICEGIDTWHWTRVLTRAPRHDDVRGEDWLRDEVLGLRHLHRHVADHAPAGGHCVTMSSITVQHLWSFIQNCVDIYIYLCKYDIPCIAAPGQPSAQIKNKKYLLRPKLFTGTTREVSLPPPPYPSIKTK